MNDITGILKYQINHQNKQIHFNLANSIRFSDLELQIMKLSMEDGTRIAVTILPNSEIKLKEVKLFYPLSLDKNDTVFLNGYQSWTESREFRVNSRIPRFSFMLSPLLNYYKVKNFGDAHFYRYSGNKGELHGYTYTYIKKPDHHLSFIGSLNDKNGFTRFQYNSKKNNLIIEKDCKGLIFKSDYQAFDLFFTNGLESGVFKHYFSKLSLKKAQTFPVRSGWTSWYNYYTRISEEIILVQLDNFSQEKVPIDLFQIDDGYQLAVGDWLDIKSTFPHGMKFIADKIKKNGYIAGIWIAPFICQKRSSLFQKHPDWILKKSNGRKVRAGYSRGYWNDHFYALDFYHPEVRAYLKKVFKVILNDWGFDMVKVDFIYALGLHIRSDKTRAQILYEGLEFLRELTGNKILLACGSPLASVFGLTDYCRIGSDVSLSWDNALYKMIHYRERVSTINSMLNTIYRRQLNSYVFGNDPDVFILREENNDLSFDQRYSLFLINQILGALVLTSDNISRYSSEILNLYHSSFPLKPKKNIQLEGTDLFFTITFEIDDKTYLAYTNLDDRFAELDLPEGFYFHKDMGFFGPQKAIVLKPYQSICFLKMSQQLYQIAGSLGHIFPGSEVKIFQVDNNEIHLELDEQALPNDILYIKIPDGKKDVIINGEMYKAQKIENQNVVIYHAD